MTVRVLADGVGSKQMLRALAPTMRRDGIDVRAMLPVNHFRALLRRLDLRNHRKIVIIDGRIAYTGSQNLMDPSYGHCDLVWRDVMCRLTGPLATHLQAVFATDWYMEAEEPLETEEIFPRPVQTGTGVAQVLPSGPTYQTQNYQRLIVAALYSARRRVIITTPYFIPDEAFLQALEVAVMRDVQVDIVVPQRSDQVLVGAATRSYYDRLLEVGVKVHLHTDGLLHAKTMTIDDRIAFFGSSNFDIRSFAINFEITLVFYSEAEATAIHADQELYIDQSILLQADEWRARPGHRKAFESIAKLFSPLLIEYPISNIQSPTSKEDHGCV